MDLGLSDKVVFVTGASGGIGRALADAFAAEGARLVLHGHGAFAELEAWLAGRSWRAHALAVQADVARAEEVERAFDRAVERFGRVDVAVANAGRWPSEDLPLWRLPEERLRQSLEANLLGAVWTARAFLARLERAGPRADGHGAALVVIGSTAGRFGERGHADYALAKAGLFGLVQSLKTEIVTIDPYGRVNLIEPGWTATHMARPALEQPGNIARTVRTMPLRQIGRAVDVARAALFLASPLAARHVTGQVLTVAGGMEGRTLWEADTIDEDAIRARMREA
jgi:3-oxoacyl-[acyl-carrier protein] reductase